MYIQDTHIGSVNWNKSSTYNLKSIPREQVELRHGVNAKAKAETADGCVSQNGPS